MRQLRRWTIEIVVAVMSVLLAGLALWIEREEHTVRVVLADDNAVAATMRVGGHEETLTAQAIDGTDWLFLPGSTEGGDLSSNGRDDGTVTNDRTLTLTDTAGRNRTVHILTGSAQPSIFLTLEHDLERIREDETKETADDGDALILLGNGGIAYNGELEEIHGRGNASWAQDKKGYNIELANAVELDGLDGAYESFALVSHTDTSYVRNRISLEIMRAAGGLALDYITVDLYINGEYQGLYELHERVGADTVGITDLAAQNKSLNKGSGKPEQLTTDAYADDWNASVTGKWWNYEKEPSDITGGYIIEADDAIRYEQADSGFITSLGTYFTLKSPSKVSAAEYSYISTYTQQVEDAMLAAVGSDSYESLSALIDVPSFEAKYLVEEISKNIDTCVTSQYFYKDVNGILYAGPVWDHDWAYGCDRVQEDIDYTDPAGFSANAITGSLTWYQLLYYNQAFQADVRSLYGDTLSALVQDIANSRIDAWQEEMERSAVMDLILWHAYESDDPDAVREAYYTDGDEVADFLIARDAFLLSQWGE